MAEWAQTETILFQYKHEEMKKISSLIEWKPVATCSAAENSRRAEVRHEMGVEASEPAWEWEHSHLTQGGARLNWEHEPRAGDHALCSRRGTSMACLELEPETYPLPIPGEWYRGICMTGNPLTLNIQNLVSDQSRNIRPLIKDHI